MAGTRHRPLDVELHGVYYTLAGTHTLLARDDEDFEVLTSILGTVSRQGVRSSDNDKDLGLEPALLRVIYHAEPARYEEVLARLHRVGVQVVAAELGAPE